MFYYYAHTGHKLGLERARRGAAVIKKAEEEGIEMRLLVNDFRAGVAMKAYGIDSYVTIETVQDIDAVASIGDVVVIDSPEDHKGRLAKYCSEYKTVFRFATGEQDRVCYDEIIIKPACNEEQCVDAVIVDTFYFREEKREDSVLFFLGDADHDKTIAAHADFFKACQMELLLGNYFFVKYEYRLATLFPVMHEPETYREMIGSSGTVVTASGQAALEAKAGGAKVVYLDLGTDALYPVELLSRYGIRIVKGFDLEAVKKMLAAEPPSSREKILHTTIGKILSKYQ